MQRKKRELDQVLTTLGMPVNDDTRAHLDVLLRCMDTYVERTESYGQVWKQYGAMSNLLNAARKVDRLMESWWFQPDGAAPAMHKDNLDDALDGIGYLTFFMRNAEIMNLTGQPPERPGGLKLVDG